MVGPQGFARLPELDALPNLKHGFEQQPPALAESLEARRARASRALAASGRLLLLRQVHGARVQAAPWEGRPEADAATADRAGLLIGIETADCLPVLLVDPRRGAVAAAHAGWRGTAAGVAHAAAHALIDAGSRRRDLIAALGPAIGPCCYEVGEELREVFGSPAAAFFSPGTRGRPHLDLRGLNRAQLLAVGLDPSRVLSLDHCTRCRADLYPSFRRDGPGSGRMLSFVGFEPRGAGG